MDNWQNRDKKIQKRRDTKKATKMFQRQKEGVNTIQQRQRRQDVQAKEKELNWFPEDTDSEV